MEALQKFIETITAFFKSVKGYVWVIVAAVGAALVGFIAWGSMSRKEGSLQGAIKLEAAKMEANRLLAERKRLRQAVDSTEDSARKEELDQAIQENSERLEEIRTSAPAVGEELLQGFNDLGY